MQQPQVATVSPVVEAPSKDFQNTRKETVTLPNEWWAKLDAICKKVPVGRVSLVIQLVSWSLEISYPSNPDAEPVPPPSWPEGPEMERGNAKQGAATLAEFRWEQIESEKGRRGWPKNRVFQAHLKRALDDYERIQREKEAAEKSDKKVRR